MSKKQFAKIVYLSFFQLSAIQANPLLDYSTLINILMSRELVITIGFITILYVNRSCWKKSYENAQAQRERYERLYCEMTHKFLAKQIENEQLQRKLQPFLNQEKSNTAKNCHLKIQ